MLSPCSEVELPQELRLVQGGADAIFASFVRIFLIMIISCFRFR